MNIAEAYNHWSETYDEMANKTRDLEAKALRESLHAKKFQHSLELGCGTGKNTFWLAEHSQSITALDFSEKMMAQAIKRDNENKVNFKQADLNKSWPVPSKYFKLISCSLVLEHIENLDFIFAEAYRSLKEDGEFYCCELHPFKQYMGSKARYETSKGTKELVVYQHHLSDYLQAATQSGLRLISLKEWFDRDQKEIPRLISFIFKK